MAVLHRPNKQRYQKIVNSLTEFFELDIIDIPNKDVLKIIEESNVLSKYDFVFILGIISYREKQACQRAGVNWIFLEKAFTILATLPKPGAVPPLNCGILEVLILA